MQLQDDESKTCLSRRISSICNFVQRIPVLETNASLRWLRWPSSLWHVVSAMPRVSLGLTDR